MFRKFGKCRKEEKITYNPLIQKEPPCFMVYTLQSFYLNCPPQMGSYPYPRWDHILIIKYRTTQFYSVRDLLPTLLKPDQHTEEWLCVPEVICEVD